MAFLSEAFRNLAGSMRQPTIEQVLTEPVQPTPEPTTLVNIAEIEELKKLAGYTISQKNGVARLLLDTALSLQPNDLDLANTSRKLWLNKGVIPFHLAPHIRTLHGIIEYGDLKGNVIKHVNGELTQTRIQTIVSRPIKQAFADFERSQQTTSSPDS